MDDINELSFCRYCGNRLGRYVLMCDDCAEFDTLDDAGLAARVESWSLSFRPVRDSRVSGDYL